MSSPNAILTTIVTQALLVTCLLIPQEIYNKPEQLSDEEFTEIKHHTLYGYKILKDTLKFGSDASNIALHHHERMDGLGYPNGLTKNEIPLFAKIASVCDAYDVMITGRKYSKAISKEEAIQEIRDCSGTQFDKEVADKFIESLGK